jgi:putative transcriptional regulator
MTEAQIQAGAEGDVDNPPLGHAELAHMRVAREVRRIRERTGLSQPQFAALCRIGLGRLRDFEQARSLPDLLVMVFCRLIDEDPRRAETLTRAVEGEFVR